MTGKTTMNFLFLILGLSVIYCNAGEMLDAKMPFLTLGIFKAMKTGNSEHFKELTKQILNYLFIDNQYLLRIAAEKGNEENVEFLLQSNDTDVNKANSEGYSPMIYAAVNENEKVINSLKEHGGNVNAADNSGITVLHTAAINGNEKVVETLLNKGANMRSINSNNESVLHWAAINPNEKVIQLLINKGANIHLKNKDGETPLAVAALYNTNEKVIELLVKAGASINEPNIKGWTPCICAIVNGNGLLKEGIESEIIDRPFIYLETKRNEFLLNLWKNPQQKHAGERTMEVLINNGANINEKVTDDQITAYDAAEIIGDESMKDFLIKHGANAAKV